MVKQILKAISFLCYMVLTYIGILIFLFSIPNNVNSIGIFFYVVGLIQYSIVEECMM